MTVQTIIPPARSRAPLAREIDRTVRPAAPSRELPLPRSLRDTIGRMVRRLCDRLIAPSSLVPNDPVLDVRLFPWTQALRENWQAIRAEAEAVATGDPAAAWRCLFLWDRGERVAAAADRCPVTAELVARIPGARTAFFSILAAGVHVPCRRGETKALISCQLGLTVPRDGDARMRVGDRTVRWAEGETLVFDDSYRHEIWNETRGPRLVLMIHVARPLRQPGRWIAGLVLRAPRARRIAGVEQLHA